MMQRSRRPKRWRQRTCTGVCALLGGVCVGYFDLDNAHAFALGLALGALMVVVDDVLEDIWQRQQAQEGGE